MIEFSTNSELSSVDWGNLLTALISAGAGVVGAMFVFRAKQKEDKHLLIDQLQEERNLLRDQLAAQRIEDEKRFHDKALSRQHVADLRRQINTGTPPPPVPPPPGYIE